MIMNREEARARLDAACAALIRGGWTQAQVDTALAGLQREDAVERADELLDRQAAGRDAGAVAWYPPGSADLMVAFDEGVSGYLVYLRQMIPTVTNEGVRTGGQIPAIIDPGTGDVRYVVEPGNALTAEKLTLAMHACRGIDMQALRDGLTMRDLLAERAELRASIHRLDGDDHSLTALRQQLRNLEFRVRWLRESFERVIEHLRRPWWRMSRLNIRVYARESLLLEAELAESQRSQGKGRVKP